MNDKDWSYEATVTEIEEIISQIESGILPLESIFDRFEVAVKQLHQCEQFLEKGKERLELAIEQLEDEST